ncbi:MAG: 4-hydroxybenzoate octaprenyltransferase [Bacteroidetes bacterium]|nr:MAG: 4-hydroxybenzoate octaprenyltransferase [Bacteroidota bacterium]
MLAFFKLIRLPNLLIMAFTMCMVRYFLVRPILDLQNCAAERDMYHSQVSPLYFYLLVLAVVLIGAAGYIINDYFDVRIDKLNRPDTNVIDRGIKRRWAIMLHTVFNVTGVLLGIFISWKSQLLTLGLMLFIGAPTLLWFYSTDFKTRMLIGNVVIALLSGMVPLLVALFEVRALNMYYGQDVADISPQIAVMSSYFALFAFLISLMREIIKDTEDYEGDRTYGCRTLPIVAGIARAKWVVAIICFVMIALIGFFEYRIFASSEEPQFISWAWKTFAWFMLLVQVPLLFLSWKIGKATGKKDYRFASLLTKIIMLGGISYLFLFSYILHEWCSLIN